MKYPVSNERLGDPSLKLDGDIQQNISQIAYILSSYTGIEYSKLYYFIENFGLNKILNEPSIIGVSAEQETTISELKELILLLGEENNGTMGTNNNVKPV